MAGEIVYCDDYEALTGKKIPTEGETEADAPADPEVGDPETKVITPETPGVETGE